MLKSNKVKFAWYIPGYEGYNLIALLLRVTNVQVIPGTIRDTTIYELEDGLFNNIPEESLFSAIEDAQWELHQRKLHSDSKIDNSYELFKAHSGKDAVLFPPLLAREWFV